MVCKEDSGEDIFIEKVEEQLGNCIDPEFPAQTMYYVRKRKGLKQTYRDKTVDGIILDVTERIMLTPSLVTDALLGQGEALDCYNQQLQDAAVQAAGLNNAAMELQNQSTEQLQRTDDKLIVGSTLLRKHIDLKASNLTAVALAEPLKLTQEQIGTLLQPRIIEKSNQINEIQLTRIAKEGLRPMVMEKLGGYETQVKIIKQPPKPVPYFAIVEEYTTCSYLGDYGAGRTIKTFSLLPGEKTTITVKTYKETNETKSNSENVLDSFSESSTNELEKILESETGLSNSSTDGSSSTSSSSKNGNVGGNVGVSLFGIVNIGVNGGYQKGSATSDINSTSSTRANNVRSLNKALDKHISISNANRSINVNNTTSESYKEGEENATVREVANINKSRVLNFVFRQLLQQYITVTTLSNIKIAFCNGYEESLRVVDLEELDKLLEDTVAPEFIEQARQTILKNYCTVFNHIDKPINFVEKIEYKIGE